LFLRALAGLRRRSRPRVRAGSSGCAAMAGGSRSRVSWHGSPGTRTRRRCTA